MQIYLCLCPKSVIITTLTGLTHKVAKKWVSGSTSEVELAVVDVGFSQGRINCQDDLLQQSFDDLK